MKTRTLAIAAIATALGTAGCATRTEYVEIEPECSVPPKPAELDSRIEHDLEDGAPLKEGTDIDPPGREAYTLEETHRLLAPGEAYAPGDLYWSIRDRDKALTDWALEMRAGLRELCGETTKAAD